MHQKQTSMSVFFIVKTAVLMEIMESTRLTRGIEYSCFLLFLPLFYLIIREVKAAQTEKLNEADKFIDKAAIISVADKKGRITYVNDKFEKEWLFYVGAASGSANMPNTAQIENLKNDSLLSKERADWGALWGEFSAGQNDFDKAFFIAVQELKSRASILQADAIVSMRQDLDIDTNGFQYFDLQMYGTAVKFK